MLCGGAKACCQVSFSMQTHSWAEVIEVYFVSLGTQPSHVTLFLRGFLPAGWSPSCSRACRTVHVRALFLSPFPSLLLKTYTFALKNFWTMYISTWLSHSFPKTLTVHVNIVYVFLYLYVLSVYRVHFTLKIPSLSESVPVFLYWSSFMYLILFCTFSKCLNLSLCLSSIKLPT